MADLTGSVVEEVALAWLESTGWRIAHGPDRLAAERTDCDEVLQGRWLWVR